MKENGFLEPLPARDFHVTVALSRISIQQELPERDANDLIVRAGQRRRVVCFGGVFALAFGCAALNRRHAEFLRVGASWDHPSYQPHISFAIDDGRDLSGLTPYRGRLHFGAKSYREPFADIIASCRKG
ncbi:phage prohead protein (plasmid) [Agrobacterium leguminum]|uniref:phage prohead protein n=1 Tax=Agrobacterium leguminum TaxID=2792015 RepID=UPI0030CF2568